MTALAGYWDLGPGADVGAACARMLRAQSVYGQEDGTWVDGRIALGRRIFRRLPEDVHDRGPAVAAEAGLALVADIRIDNRAEIASALRLRAPDAARVSDAALLLRAWMKWGEEALQRVYGDLAFALWDGPRRQLIMARDMMARQPLFWHRGDGFVAFASMPKGLHALPDVPRRTDPDGLAEFLGLLHNLSSRTFFAGIRRVETGHIVTVTRDGETSRPFWRPNLEPLRLKSDDEYAEAMREQIDRAVAVRLRGAGNAIGSHLSAGLDSGAVAATAARLIDPGRVVAYTAAPKPGARMLAPKGRLIDEFADAARTAALYPNIEHVRIETAGRSPLDSLDRAYFLYDRPRLNLCNSLWLDAIKDDARDRGLKVLLTGELGNIAMSYSGEHLIGELMARFRFLAVLRTAIALRRNGTRFGTIAASAIGPFLPKRLWTMIARARGHGGLRYHSGLRPEIGASAAYQGRARELDVDLVYQPLADATKWRFRTLRRFDAGVDNKATLGGWGVDLRDPTADRALIEFCMRVPTDQFLRNGTYRSLARRALADRLPAEIVGSKVRGYHGADWPEGLVAGRAQIAAEVQALAALPEAQVFDVERLRGLVDNWPEDWSDPDLLDDHRHVLLRAVSASHFARRTAGSNL